MRHFNLKNLLLIAGLVFFSACSAEPVKNVTEADVPNVMRMGSHGMAVIGTEDLLFNHMALYRAPHDRQILTPATFAHDTDRSAFETWKAEYTGLVSIVPENFDLNRLSPTSDNRITAFNADIYEGHFERGGELKFEAINFNLGSPVLHRPVQDVKGKPNRFYYVQSEDTAYLVREIGNRPGKDEVIEVKPNHNAISAHSYGVNFITQPDQRIVLTNQDGEEFEFSQFSLAYLETSDFK